MASLGRDAEHALEDAVVERARRAGPRTRHHPRAAAERQRAGGGASSSRNWRRSNVIMIWFSSCRPGDRRCRCAPAYPPKCRPHPSRDLVLQRRNSREPRLLRAGTARLYGFRAEVILAAKQKGGIMHRLARSPRRRFVRRFAARPCRRHARFRAGHAPRHRPDGRRRRSSSPRPSARPRCWTCRSRSTRRPQEDIQRRAR